MVFSQKKTEQSDILVENDKTKHYHDLRSFCHSVCCPPIQIFNSLTEMELRSSVSRVQRKHRVHTKRFVQNFDIFTLSKNYKNNNFCLIYRF